MTDAKDRLHPFVVVVRETTRVTYAIWAEDEDDAEWLATAAALHGVNPRYEQLYESINYANESPQCISVQPSLTRHQC
jgi:hypothetical protein